MDSPFLRTLASDTKDAANRFSAAIQGGAAFLFRTLLTNGRSRWSEAAARLRKGGYGLRSRSFHRDGGRFAMDLTRESQDEASHNDQAAD